MVKSTASCFKVITCGSNSVDHDDLQVPESKGSSGRGWSFRKRSARHRVLSNTVISESVNKENSDSTAVTFQPQTNKESSDSDPVSFHPQHNLTVPEKTSTIQITVEKIEISAQPDSGISDDKSARKDDCEADAMLDESIVIVIQAGVRGFMAQRLLLKQKNIIKLQAAVRGHLVRRHAVGTLRCVQAIVKIQALVRARHARVRVERSSDFENQSENNGNHNNVSSFSSERRLKPQVAGTYISIEKLLSNRFARQLMESTPRGEPINIKCDPLKSDSAWKWLERWMSVSSPSNEEPQDSGSADVQPEKVNAGCSEGKNEVLVPSNSHLEPTVLKSSEDASAEASENDDKLINDDENNMGIRSTSLTTPASSQTKCQDIDELHKTFEINEFAPVETNKTELMSDLEAKAPQTEDKTGSDTNLPDSRKRSAEQPETEAKKLSRKASNPSFIAAQSKFEELSSTGGSAKLTTSSLENGLESTLDKVFSHTEQPLSSKEIELADNSISNASVVQIGGSDCGTELSISSTLDSPDRSEIEANQLEQEPKIPDVTDHPSSLGLEANGKSIMLGADPDDAITHQLERCETVNSVTGELERYESVESITGELERCETVDIVTGESVSSTRAVVSPQLPQEPKEDLSNLLLELESEATHPIDQLSPAASPRSHITFPESQATPSSQVSVKTKKNKSEKSGSSHKKRSSSAEKKSHSNPNQDSGSKRSFEQEHKSGIRRNSFSSAKHDADQEQRDSRSSISVPSYMQATESARAKLIANVSPRSSPDVHAKDTIIKKRHSLPGTNGRQGSPSIQRSLYQAKQNAKGNGAHSPQDRKWQR